VRTLYSRAEYGSVSSASARRTIEAIADDFQPLDSPPPDERWSPGDPLQWPGYAERLRRAQRASNESEAVVTGAGTVDGHAAIVLAMDFRFMAGSMGAAAGARIAGAIDEARRRRLPVVSLIASGGARVQEGIYALIQMQRIAAACAAARADGIPHIAVLRHPTTGGVWAALGSVADFIVGLDGATVAFAGPRVRGGPDAGRPEFTSGGQREHGAIDQVVSDAELRSRVALAVELLGPAGRGQPRPAEVPRALAGAPERDGSGFRQVLAARHPGRPRATDYLDDYFDVRLETGGDRAGGLDAGMLCGFGRRQGRTIAYVAQTGGANMGAGFRAATRLVELAGRLRVPVLTLIDTPGAANDAEAERGSVGTAIGELFQAVAASPVPITSLVIGEGGSGGALALASHDRLWITPDAYFAVIAPEAAAAILHDEALATAEIADRMRLTPRDLLSLGVVHGLAGSSAAPVEGR
jgi:acetyl-CoA carboxylase beta subunit